MDKTGMVKDSRGKMISLSNMLVELPSSRILTAYLLVVSVVAGFLMQLFRTADPLQAAFYGSAHGFWVLFLPALLTYGLLSYAIKKHFDAYALASALLVTSLVASGYVLGSLVQGLFGSGLYTAVLVVNAASVAAWLIALRVVLSAGPRMALALCGAHAVFNLAALVVWNGFGLIAGLGVSVSSLSLLQFVLSAGILLLALGALVYVLNAPSERNFGVSTTEALALFFAQWVHGEQGLEDFFGGFGQKVRTWIGAVAFRRKDGSLKAAFLVPQIHFGPFGNLGSSRLPQQLSDYFRREFESEAFTFHGLVNHDMNLVHSREAEVVAQQFGDLVRTARPYASAAFLDLRQVGETRVAALGFGRSAWISLTRAPHSTEDFDLGAGLALRNLALRRFDEALVVDRHNSLTNGEMFDVGSDVYNRYVDAVESLRVQSGGSLRLGVASDSLPEFSIPDGIGGAGLKVAVFSMGRKKACVVLVDGNNAVPDFRAKVLKRLEPFGFDLVDLYTSDTHSVNTIGGIHNPVGARLDRVLLMDRIVAAVRLALDDLEPVKAAVSARRIDVSVLGVQRQAELLSTINAIVSVAKVVAPLVFLISIGLVLLALRWVSP
ncbi:DUF2070 family protein [Candidatus Micrarchaeota archaeon]|nr:DUF2070 family protein [Candidatus Micrarchaeota archaeon]